MRLAVNKVLIVAAALIGTALGAGVAHADDAVRCQVFEIKASSGESERIDPRLRPIRDKLRQAPFRAWNVFEALESHRITAERRRPVKLSLAPGGEMTLLYRDTSQAEGRKPRLRLSLTLDDAEGKRLMDATIQLDSGDWYLVGGESLSDDATYILATGCQVD